MTSPIGSTGRPARDEAPAPYHSPSLEVLATLEIENAVSAIESRLDSMEIDLARLAGGREDDQRRIAGEMAVLRARVEDAVAAIGQTADELRATARSLEARFATRPDSSVGRDELDAGIEGVAAGVGDVIESVAAGMHASIASLGEQFEKLRESLERLTPAEPDAVAARLAALERTVAGLLAAATRPI